MKSKKQLSIISCLTAAFLFSVINSNAQQPWRTNGNNVNPGDFLGSNNNADVVIKTHDSARIIIGRNGSSHFLDSISFDSSSIFRGQAIFFGHSGDAILPEPGILPGPQDDHWFTTNRYSIMGAHFVLFPFPHWVANSLKSFGVSTQNPSYMLDVLCDPAFGSKSDINVSTTAPTQNVGYRIGDSMIIWHNGIISSLFTGVFAGGPTPSGVDNTFTGNLAGYYNDNQNDNTYTGYAAGYGTSPFNFGQYNTYTGSQSGYSNQGGSFNTFTGWRSGFFNTGGHHDDFYGKRSGFCNVNGQANSFFGSHSGFWEGNVSEGDSNAFFGNQTGANEQGSENVFVGCFAGCFGNQGIPFVPPYNDPTPFRSFWNVFVGTHTGTNSTGSYNVLLGAKTDAIGAINDAGALGGEAITIKSHQFILGNNQQFMGIGLSNDPTTLGPEWNLEIATENNVANSIPNLGHGFYNTHNPYFFAGTGTGFTGLKFRDLTSFSTPCSPLSPAFNFMTNPYPDGVLSVDGKGNVIYVEGTKGTLAANNCPNLTQLTVAPGAGYDLNNTGNFYFAGNFNGTGINNVVIGNNCTYSPKAKLDVFQNANATGPVNSTGIFVVNSDQPTPTACPHNLPTVMGIASLLNGANNMDHPKIAGFFAAPGTFGGCSTNINNYCLFSPMGGGVSSLGWAYSLAPQPLAGTTILQINGSIIAGPYFSVSDSKLKKDTVPYKGGLSLIRKIQPITYRLNGKAGMDTAVGTMIGVIAEKVAPVIPLAVDTFYDRLDSTDANATALLAVNGEAIMYTSLNAIKQLDSNVTAQGKTDSSLVKTVDSLKSVLNSLQACINKLCGGGARMLQNNDNGDGNNTQYVTLSNSAILYQNAPNPFGDGGTKINYYLPENTVGASIVFYDMYGNQLKTVQLSQTGAGTINVNPDKLSNGIYTYSLVINGNIVATKKMVYAK